NNNNNNNDDDENANSDDNEIIEQYEMELREKDNVISELKDELAHLRQVLGIPDDVNRDLNDDVPSEEKKNSLYEQMDTFRSKIYDPKQLSGSADVDNSDETLTFVKHLSPAIDELEHNGAKLMTMSRSSNKHNSDTYQDWKQETEQIQASIESHLCQLYSQLAHASQIQTTVRDVENNLQMLKSIVSYLANKVDLKAEEVLCKPLFFFLKGEIDDTLNRIQEAKGDLRDDELRSRKLQKRLREAQVTVLETTLQLQNQQKKLKEEQEEIGNEEELMELERLQTQLEEEKRLNDDLKEELKDCYHQLKIAKYANDPLFLSDLKDIDILKQLQGNLEQLRDEIVRSEFNDDSNMQMIFDHCIKVLRNLKIL
ncbi:viral A-type inclusion protein, partial [Reticulomyxa filosa]